MSLESVRSWLAQNAPDLELIEVAESTATVETAAKAPRVEGDAAAPVRVGREPLGRFVPLAG